MSYLCLLSLIFYLVNVHCFCNDVFLCELPSSLFVCTEDAGSKQEAVKILPWETRIEDKSIFSHVSFTVYNETDGSWKHASIARLCGLREWQQDGRLVECCISPTRG